ncbi:MAG: M20/M25/M40 family metallo-hydrolase [Pyrinomonadaceae bacterium]
MRHKFLRLLLVFALVPSAFAQQRSADAPDAARLRVHVTYLASDKLEGRRTGTPGADMAAKYIAGEFARLRLSPGGDNLTRKGEDNSTGHARSFLQTFPYIAGVEPGKGNAMTLTTRAAEASPPTPPATLDLRLGEDWMPLGFSANGRVENTTVAFVGYGITAADENYDDYKGADVKDKIALAFAGTPDGDNPHGKFVRAGQLRFKAAAARAAGARALVIITGEENFKDERMSRLAYDNEIGDAALPVVVVSRQAAAKILGVEGVAPLTELEKLVREQSATVGGDWATRIKSNTPRGTTLTVSTDIVRRETSAFNVVGVLEGSDPRLKSEAIVIGAHYDHLGHGGQGSLAPKEGEIHHGADDNASGTAGLLELARLLSGERAKLRRTVVFIAFSGEEEGLLGSGYYVEHPSLPVAQTVAMINMDMIGRMKADRKLIVGGVGTAQEWRGWIEHENTTLHAWVKTSGEVKVNPKPAVVATASATAATHDATNGRATPPLTGGFMRRFDLTLNDDGYGPSDHSSFYAKKIPVLFFFTGTHEDYHKPSDTADRLNYDGEAHILSFVRDLVAQLEAGDNRPAYTVAKSEGAGRSIGFRVYLGTIPNYGEATDGLKLDGVRENSPAEKAGLKAGDRIVKLAGRDVRNVYDYTNALSEMKAGQEYEVEVIRDGQPLALKITPAARK